MAGSGTFTWWHFSDLKCAPEPHRSGSRFGESLVQLLAGLPSSDAIFLTGDAVDHESNAFPEAQGFINRAFYGTSGAPFLLVPGNNDCVRTTSELTHLFRLWGEDPAIRDQFWSAGSELRKLAGQSFAGFEKFAAQLKRPPSWKGGLLPGDFSATIECGKWKIGIAGLNCVFNQISLRPPDSGLLDVRQLDAVCGGDPAVWAERHDLRILLTHYPPERLDKSVLTHFYSEIAPPGRFQLHLCGHRHGPSRSFKFEEQHATRLQAPRVDLHDPPSVQGFLLGHVDWAHPKSAYAAQHVLDQKTRHWHHAIEPLAIRLSETKTAAKAAEANGAEQRPSCRLKEIRLKNFKVFEDISVSFDHETRLGGDWTCLAGINGAGKSSIVQAICLAFLGDPLVHQLGGGLLNRLRRLNGEQRSEAVIQAAFESNGYATSVELRIGVDGAIYTSTSEAINFWKSLRSRLLLAYGATRNLSSRPLRDQNDTKSPEVERFSTVFDPLSQLTGAETLLSATTAPPSVAVLFPKLINAVFHGEVEVVDHGGRVKFRVAGDQVDAVDLPDGFRSSAAWLADLCVAWAERFPDEARKGDPGLIDAIVVIDELDLHLHPSLQRELVPRLRAALPRVQWIVTTHSPLILSNFDSNEIIALDRRAEGGIRQLDRQILGFTTDQIYQWLMGTEPSGAALEQEMGKPVMKRGELAQLLMMSPGVDETEARGRIGALQSKLKQLKS